MEEEEEEEEDVKNVWDDVDDGDDDDAGASRPPCARLINVFARRVMRIARLEISRRRAPVRDLSRYSRTTWKQHG